MIERCFIGWFKLFITLALCWVAGAALGQTVDGQIVDAQGKGVPAATVYICETAQGLMADEDGRFRFEIAAGVYTCEASSLGYERKTLNISVPPEGLKINIVLEEKTYRLREVVVTPGKENPAYRVMRNVIARAPYHLRQVKSYKSTSYVKGTFKIEKLPLLIRSQIKDRRLLDMLGKTLLYESQSEINYTEPNKYVQKILAVSSTLPDEIHINETGVMMDNIYRPTANGGLLAPGSFSVYKFSLEDVYTEDRRTIYKIRIIPKKKSSLLVAGMLYIVEDLWTVQQADISQEDAGVKITYHLNYKDIRGGAYLPVTYEMSLNVSLMGIKGGGQFYASLKYSDLETKGESAETKPNRFPKPVRFEGETEAETKPNRSLRPVRFEENKQLESLLNKEKLTTREAYKAAKLMEAQAASDEEKRQKRSLEVAPRDSLVRITHDSLALLRDSAFWAGVRTVPLRTDELQSYIRRDSMKQVTDSLRSADSLPKRTAGKWLSHLFMGERITIDSGRFFFKYSGLLSAAAEYNFVDGYWLGQKFSTGVKLAKHRTLTLTPSVYWATARKSLIFNTELKLPFATLRHGELTLAGGNTSADYAGLYSAGRLGNALTSFIYAGNTVNYYQKRYLSFSGKMDAANGLLVFARIKYEKRNSLENNTSFNLFKRQPAPNLPHGQTAPMPSHEVLTATLNLSWTPRQRYRLHDGQKFYLYSDFPTFRLGYTKAFASPNSLNSSYDKVEAFAEQDVKISLFSRLSYQLNAGRFITSKRMYLPDYRHFYTNESMLTTNDLNVSFSNLENYSHAASNKWLQAHAALTSDYLLLKQLPFLQGYMFDEALHLHSLVTDGVYFEVGYSVGISGLGRIGVSTGFNRLKVRDIALTISLPLLRMFE